ncbi:hypothetical protein BABINDRAFT_160347 [Babjeviella inositovora NRRL Y-12698]|uniref:MICOS complex subunit n=1 Tax=Babjeviella inositovora NRRL Y-12698 TaxID=984486 RepID=A0A1E3QTA2_9ASCO|nr:uncharacterized protein BABINDRAFT_160347 [Babjeviella inositovora NRRL Y-12698]ODQ80900.1 hypothetical protein BABINDRAFT_160347 [Babjeviella inositovora NRRL Y-12698]
MVAAAVLMSAPAMNEPRRRFYEDEEHVTPIPGTITAPSGTELEILGQNTLIDGISVRSPSFLQSSFRAVRLRLNSFFESVESLTHEVGTQYYNTERKVTSTFSELRSRDEDLLPNSLYVVTAFLSGGIVARRRGIVARAVAPVVLGLAAFKYFLPQTFSNTARFIWSWEKQQVPELAAKQEEAVKTLEGFSESVEKSTGLALSAVEGQVQGFRKSIANVTGLNLDEEVSKKN